MDTSFDPADLVALDATALASSVHSGKATSRQLVEATLDRIETLDAELNAFRVVMSEQALEEADRIDSLQTNERQSLPMAGVPIAIKDDTDVAGESTMWGTGIDRGVCTEDADVVDRLRRAGAIIIGKTNVPELTLWPWTESERWGVTRNPWNRDRTPGGSSGGSAVAVSSGMAAMALGSDGGGSIRYPAALTGLVGLKPQRDRIPLGPEHASGWHGLIALGPLTRSVRDAALFLDVASARDALRTFRDATEEEFRPIKVAVSPNPPPGSQVSLSTEGRRALDDAASLLADVGHEIIEIDISYGLSALWNSTVRLLQGANDDVASMPNQDLLESRTRSVARMGRTLPARSLRKALSSEGRIADSINEVFHLADVVLTPLCASPAPSVQSCPKRGAMRSLRASNTSAWLVPWNLIGQPAVSVPTGLDANGLPAAIHLAGRPGREAQLLRLASQIETRRPFPRLPADRGGNN